MDQGTFFAGLIGTMTVLAFMMKDKVGLTVAVAPLLLVTLVAVFAAFKGRSP
jgi:hypothetical protein